MFFRIQCPSDLSINPNRRAAATSTGSKLKPRCPHIPHFDGVSQGNQQKSCKWGLNRSIRIRIRSMRIRIEAPPLPEVAVCDKRTRASIREGITYVNSLHLCSRWWNAPFPQLFLPRFPNSQSSKLSPSHHWQKLVGKKCMCVPTQIWVHFAQTTPI